MIINDDPTSAGIFRLPTPESIAGFDDDQLERAADRAAGERAGQFQRFALARSSAIFTAAAACIAVPAALGVIPSITGNSALTVVTVFMVLVFAVSVVVVIARRNEVIAWNAAEVHRRRGGAR